MGDTFPSLAWAIERRCPLRRGRDWQLPHVTSRRLGDLRDLNGTVFDGVCVTSHWSFELRADLPASGFVVAEATARFGGEGRVRATCAACKANVGHRDGGGVAGCHGYLGIDPDSTELDDALRRASERLGLSERLSRLFPATTPWWYGFWIGSPLDRERLEILSRLLEEASMRWTDVPGGDRFVEALRTAAATGLALHARLDPPAHVDLGWYSLYPHCPRCLAALRRHDPSPRHRCRACGHEFDPASTSRQGRKGSRIDPYGPERPYLDYQLGADRWREFAGRYLLWRGYPAAEAERYLADYVEWSNRARECHRRAAQRSDGNSASGTG